jgi:RHS repeat-associated protein
VNKTDAYGYDAAGNTTSRDFNGAAQTLTWDAEGHLQKITEGASTLEDNLYDADGNRMIRREPSIGKTTLFWGTHTELTLNTSTGGITGTRYYDYAAYTIAVRTGIAQADVTTLVPDHHGTAAYAVGDTTGVLSVRRLDPFGNPRGTPPASWPGQRGYVNGTPDNAVGLTHLGARDYDPTLGRFVSVDPLIDINQPETLNAYAYSNNSPVTLSDPDGTRPMDAGNGGELHVKPLKAWAKTNTKAVAHRTAPPTADERQREHIIGTRNGKRMHGAGSSGSFDFSVNFITDEMKRNSQSDAALFIRAGTLDDRDAMLGIMKKAFAKINNQLGLRGGPLSWAAYALFAKKVCQGCDWDHKGDFKRFFHHEGETGLFHMRVPDTDVAISHDLWSNIHYGYVGTEVGIPAHDLKTFGSDPPDLFDSEAIQIGIDLRNRYEPDDLTPEVVRSAVLSRLRLLTDLGGYDHVQQFDPSSPRMEP